MGSSKVPTDRMKDALMRRRVANYIGDPEASKMIEEMTGAEIVVAIKAAIYQVLRFIRNDVKFWN